MVLYIRKINLISCGTSIQLSDESQSNEHESVLFTNHDFYSSLGSGLNDIIFDIYVTKSTL